MNRSPGFYQFRRLTFLMQLYAGLSWVVAWFLRDASYSYSTPQLALLVACFSIANAASLLARSPRQLILAAFTTVVVLTESFRVLAMPSANAPIWTVALATIFTLATAPVFNQTSLYLACTAIVWLVFGHPSTPVVADVRDRAWGVLLQTGTIILGVLLNVSFVHLRRRSKNLQRTLKRMAYEDPLTGIANRRSLIDRLHALHAEHRLQGTFFLMIDLDDFKRINDSFGHDQGDTVLRDLAALLRRHAGLNIPGRLGGEEFGLVMEDCTCAEASVLAQTLVRAARAIRIDPPAASAEAPQSLTISAGLARARASETPSALMRRADEALYRAKRDGKNRFVNGESQGDDWLSVGAMLIV